MGAAPELLTYNFYYMAKFISTRMKRQYLDHLLMVEVPRQLHNSTTVLIVFLHIIYSSAFDLQSPSNHISNILNFANVTIVTFTILVASL